MSRQLPRRRVHVIGICFIILSWVLAACGPAATPVAAPAATQPSTAAPVAQPTQLPAQPTEPPAGPTEPPAKPTEPLAKPAPSGPVVLKIGWPGKPDTLNPAYAFLTQAYDIFDLVYNPLVTESSTGEYVGALAKEWKHSDDGLTWTFTLKDGIKWHDGTPFTADDIVWSINAVMADPKGWSTLSNYVAGFKEVKALDSKTVQITLDEAISNMEYRLSFLYAVYRKDFEKFKTAEDLQNFGNEQLIGTGVFKLSKYDKDQGIIILEANPDYFDGRPTLDQIIFQTYDNEEAMVQAFKVGDIDLIRTVPSTAFATIKGLDNVKAEQLPARSFDELVINSVPAAHDPKPTRNPALDDPQVRLAIATAINKADLVDIVLQGLGKPGDTIVPPALGNGFWHADNIQEVKFDLAKANQILDAAGYKAGADGVRTKGNLKLNFRLQFPSNRVELPRAADLMTGWFKQIGIKASPQSVDPDSLTAAMTPTGDYDLVLWGWGPDPDPDFILSVLTTDQFVAGGWSDSGYSNPEYDKLYRQQQITLDRTVRQKIVWQMQEIAFNARPYIVLFYDDLLQAYRSDRFKGFVESALGIISAESLKQVEPVK